jgi:hypothetical protein
MIEPKGIMDSRESQGVKPAFLHINQKGIKNRTKQNEKTRQRRIKCIGCSKSPISTITTPHRNYSAANHSMSSDL